MSDVEKYIKERKKETLRLQEVLKQVIPHLKLGYYFET